MTHLTEDAAVGRGDTLNCASGVVRVEVDVSGGNTVKVDILRCDLTVFGKRLDAVIRCKESAFTVGDRNGNDVADFAFCEPRGLVGSDAGADDAGLVTADGVERQRRAGFVGVDDLTVGNEAQLDECLEAVADTCHQTVAVVKQIGDRFLDSACTEECRDELTRAVRFVTAGEAAGNEDDLGLADLLCKDIDGLCNGCAGEVVDDEDFGFDACIGKCLCGVEFTVGTREDGDQNARFCDSDLRCDAGLCDMGERRDFMLFLIVVDVAGEDALKLAFVNGEQVGQLQCFLAAGDLAVIGGRTDNDCTARCSSGQLQQECAVVVAEHFLDRELLVISEADAVTECHLHDSFRNAAVGGRVSGCDLAVAHELGDVIVECQQGFCGGQTVFTELGLHEDDLMAGFLEFGGDDFIGIAGGDSEGNECRRNIEVFKRAGHGVLTADCRVAEGLLRTECTEQCRQRLAPTLGIAAGLFKIFLEGQVNVGLVRTSCDQLGNGFDDCEIGCMIGALHGDIGIVAPCHVGASLGVLLFNGDQVDHCLVRGQLMLAAEGHHNGTGADGGVKALGKPPLGADVEVACKRLHVVGKGTGNSLCVAFGLCGCDVDVLFRTVGVEEGSRQIDDGLAVPLHGQTGSLGHFCNNGCFEVFGGRDRAECVNVFSRNDNCHTFLGFGDCQFRAVQTVVLLGNSIEVDCQTVSKLTDGNGDTACTEVVAALDHPGCIRVAEQTLQLALLRSITLLNFCAAGGQGFLSVGLGGAGCTAAAVTAGTAAEQDDDIAGERAFTADIFCGSRCDDSTDLHTLCRVAGVVEFIDLTGSKADLVTVGGVAGSGRRDDLSLRELTCHRFGNGNGRVSGTGHTHCSIDIGTTGQRVTDRAADTGSRTAERFDFGRVVMGFVLEEEQPVFHLTFHFDLHLDGARIDFLGFIELVELADAAQILCGERTDVHQIDRLGSAELRTGRNVIVVGRLEQRIVKLDGVDGGEERGMTAMVGPVGVDHADFGDGGVAVLFILEVVAAEAQVVLIHSKTLCLDKCCQSIVIHGAEAVEGFDLGRDFVFDLQGFGLFHRSFTAFDRVDDILLDAGKIILGNGAFDDVNLCGVDVGTFALGEDLDTLSSGVCALVKLTGQILNCENRCTGDAGQLVIGDVQLRFGEDDLLCIRKEIGIYIFDVVTVEHTQTRQTFHAEQGFEVREKRTRFTCQSGLFFYKYAIYHICY